MADRGDREHAQSVPGHARASRATVARHGRTHRERRVLRSLALVLTAVVVTGASGAAAIALRISSNMNQVDNSDLLDDVARPAAPAPDPDDTNSGRAVNLLLIGSDDRTGVNGVIGGDEEGKRSDTTMFLHVSADRSRIEVVSLPRDAVVPLPACPVTGGGTTRASDGAMFNGAFARGWDTGLDLVSAATCTQLTVEQLTGIRIDGFIVVDFIGFQNVVDAIGGVPLCTREDLKDSDSGLDLPAGEHVLDGPTALALARARHDLSDGSDTHRLDRQQALVAATVRTILDSNLLTDAPALLRTVDAATSAVTVSGGFSLSGLAFSLKGVDPADVVFQTVPSGPKPGNKNRVVWTSDADTLWARLLADAAPTAPAAPADPAAPAAPADPAAPAAPADPAAAASPAPTPTVDPMADRTPGETISSADAQVACG